MPLRALSSLFRGKKVLQVLSLLLVIVLFLMPVYRLVILSFKSGDVFTLENYANILQDDKTWSVITNTVIVVAGATVISVSIGILMAWVIAYTNIRAKKLMQIFIVLPFVIPSYISTLAWTQFFGSNGLYSTLISFLPFSIEINLYSIGGIIFVLGFSHYPLVYLLSLNVFRKIPTEAEHASRVAGASGWQTFRKITLPLALPGIASGGFLAFIANLDNFGIPAFLGIPAQIDVLSTYIYQQIVGYGPSAFQRAATFSVILGVIAFSGLLIQWLLLKKSKRIETTTEEKRPRVLLGGKWRIFIETILWGFFFLTSIVPLISMIMTSLLTAYGLDFTLENISLKNYQYILETSPKAKRAIGNSLQLALIITVTGIITGTGFAYYRVRKPNRWNRYSELAISLPYALPGTVMALSMIFAWMEPLPGWNPGIYGSMMILFIAYFTRFLILQIRGSITAVLQVDYTMEEAAAVSGSNGWTKWRKILLPLMLPGILSGAFLVFLTALTELTVSSLLWSSNSETIGVIIFSFEQAGYTTYSTAFSGIIICLILAGFLLLSGFQLLWNRKVANSN